MLKIKRMKKNVILLGLLSLILFTASIFLTVAREFNQTIDSVYPIGSMALSIILICSAKVLHIYNNLNS